MNLALLERQILRLETELNELRTTRAQLLKENQEIAQEWGEKTEKTGFEGENEATGNNIEG